MLAKLKTLREEREEGFTLIELLVVILIIGILAAIAIPVFLNQRQTANDGAVQADVKNVATQVETYMAQNPSVTTFSAADVTAIAGMVKISPGVSLALSGGSNGYCIYGSHSNGKSWKSTLPGIQTTATPTTLDYNSINGGISAPCVVGTGAGQTGALPTTWNLGTRP